MLVLFFTGFRGLCSTLDTPFNCSEVCQSKFRVQAVQVPVGVYVTVNVRYVAVLKCAQHDCQGIGIADMPQELGAQSLAFPGRSLCSLTYARDIYKFDGCIGNFLGIEYFRYRLHPSITYLSNPYLALYGSFPT